MADLSLWSLTGIYTSADSPIWNNVGGHISILFSISPGELVLPTATIPTFTFIKTSDLIKICMEKSHRGNVEPFDVRLTTYHGPLPYMSL